MKDLIRKFNACNIRVSAFSLENRNPSATYHSDIYTFICSKIFNTGTLQYSNLIYHIISNAQTRREYIFIYGPDHLAVEYKMYCRTIRPRQLWVQAKAENYCCT